jgi:hypothetical protein
VLTDYRTSEKLDQMSLVVEKAIEGSDVCPYASRRHVAFQQIKNVEYFFTAQYQFSHDE